MKHLRLATLSIASAVTYQLLLLVLIFLRPDLPVYSTSISEWAIGKYGWLMQMAFFISAISYLLLFAILKDEIKGKLGKIGITLLFICFLGTVGVGIFITNPYPPDLRITKTLIHTTAGSVAMVLYPIAILLITINISNRNETWAKYSTMLKTIGFLPVSRIMFLAYHLTLIAIALLFIKKQNLKTR